MIDIPRCCVFCDSAREILEECGSDPPEDLIVSLSERLRDETSRFLREKVASGEAEYKQ
jgi:hypothetical protein